MQGGRAGRAVLAAELEVEVELPLAVFAVEGIGFIVVVVIIIIIFSAPLPYALLLLSSCSVACARCFRSRRMHPLPSVHKRGGFRLATAASESERRRTGEN